MKGDGGGKKLHSGENPLRDDVGKWTWGLEDRKNQEDGEREGDGVIKAYWPTHNSTQSLPGSAVFISLYSLPPFVLQEYLSGWERQSVRESYSK